MLTDVPLLSNAAEQPTKNHLKMLFTDINLQEPYNGFFLHKDTNTLWVIGGLNVEDGLLERGITVPHRLSGAFTTKSLAKATIDKYYIEQNATNELVGQLKDNEINLEGCKQLLRSSYGRTEAEIDDLSELTTKF